MRRCNSEGVSFPWPTCDVGLFEGFIRNKKCGGGDGGGGGVVCAPEVMVVWLEVWFCRKRFPHFLEVAVVKEVLPKTFARKI